MPKAHQRTLRAPLSRSPALKLRGDAESFAEEPSRRWSLPVELTGPSASSLHDASACLLSGAELIVEETSASTLFASLTSSTHDVAEGLFASVEPSREQSYSTTVV